MNYIEGFLLSKDINERVEDLAEFFCYMSSDDMAKFFGHVARISNSWEKPACLQWRMMQNDLTPAAKKLINDIKDHTE